MKLRFGFTVPLSRAEDGVTSVSASVVTVGGAEVVKVSTLPTVVPSEFCAMAQNQYCVPGDSPVADRVNPTDETPEPRFEPAVAGTRVPKASLQVPGLFAATRNQPVVCAPLGVPKPPSVALVEVIDVTLLVETCGAVTSVVNDSTTPVLLPCTLSAKAQYQYCVPGVSPVIVWK